jgi:hypothetical protein
VVCWRGTVLSNRRPLEARSESDDPECDMSGGRYLPMRIKMPAASAKIPIMIVGMVMWNSRVIPARIRYIASRSIPRFLVMFMASF